MSIALENKVTDVLARMAKVEDLIEAIRTDIASIRAGPERTPMPFVKFPKCLEQLGIEAPDHGSNHS